jgi:hypothetical protein
MFSLLWAQDFVAFENKPLNRSCISWKTETVELQKFYLNIVTCLPANMSLMSSDPEKLSQYSS